MIRTARYAARLGFQLALESSEQIRSTKKMDLGHAGTLARVSSIAAHFAFCSSYPIRFAIEGKSYAVLVL
tara:strand:+ start:199 stop:408 length:210 start_codon:yes stop_codon:yes gene_type:complete